MDAQTIRTGGVATAQRWLEKSDAKPSNLSSDFNWHGFSAGAAMNARAASTMTDAENPRVSFVPVEGGTHFANDRMTASVV